MEVSAQDRARKIKIIIFDVDGVLTDGGIWMIPVPVLTGVVEATESLEDSARLGKGFGSSGR